LISDYSPAREAGNDQDTRGEGEQDLPALRSLGRLKLQKITVAGAA